MFTKRMLVIEFNMNYTTHFKEIKLDEYSFFITFAKTKTIL